MQGEGSVLPTEAAEIHKASKGSVSYRRAISSVVRRGRRRAVGAGFVKEVAGLGLHPRPAAEERALALAPRL